MQVPKTITHQEVQALRNWRREETKGTDDSILVTFCGLRTVSSCGSSKNLNN